METKWPIPKRLWLGIVSAQNVSLVCQINMRDTDYRIGLIERITVTLLHCYTVIQREFLYSIYMVLGCHLGTPTSSRGSG